MTGLHAAVRIIVSQINDKIPLLDCLTPLLEAFHLADQMQVRELHLSARDEALLVLVLHIL